MLAGLYQRFSPLFTGQFLPLSCCVIDLSVCVLRLAPGGSWLCALGIEESRREYKERPQKCWEEIRA